MKLNSDKKSRYLFGNFYLCSYSCCLQGARWFTKYIFRRNECNRGWFLPTWNYWRYFKTTTGEIATQFMPYELDSNWRYSWPRKSSPVSCICSVQWKQPTIRQVYVQNKVAKYETYLHVKCNDMSFKITKLR